MKSFTRREFLSRSMIGLGAFWLSACGVPATAQPEPVLPADTATPPVADTSEPASPTATAKPKGKNGGSATAKPKGKQTQASTTTQAAVQPAPGLTMILGRPTADSIALGLLSPTAVQAALGYGTRSGDYSAQTSVVALEANVAQTIEIAGLTPDTAYFYTVLVGGAASGEHSFHTQRAPGSSFVFTIDADPHNRDPRFNGTLYSTMMANAIADRPDFHINLGDTFMTEKLKPLSIDDVDATFKDMRPYLGQIGADAALMLVNGNHEGELGWLLKDKDKDLPLWSTQMRQRNYPSPIPNSFYSGSTAVDAALGEVRDGYYAWTWGDALFVILDPFWYTTQKPQPGDLNNNWGWTLGKEQYDWLQTTLEGSQAQLRFVFIHHLVGGSGEARGGVEFASLFEWGGNNADGSFGFDAQRSGWGKPIHQILADNQVDAVFHGHDHVYVRQDLDGIVYHELPQATNAEYNNVQLAADYGYTHGDILGSSGHLRVTVEAGKARVDYVRAYIPDDPKYGPSNGKVDFSYTLG